MAKKILIVDDDPEILRLLASRLKNSGYDVVSASDGESGLKKAITKKPDLVLLDIIMPGLNGFEVCKRLKENDKTKLIPVIMLTALAGEKDLSKGLEEGAVCFITKPFSAEDLLHKIKTAMQD
ncbi:MAG: response regulator [Candidatus Aminicenantes bacterium]